MRVFYKLAFFRHLLTLKVIKNTKDDILKNVGKQTVDGNHWFPYWFVTNILNISSQHIFCKTFFLGEIPVNVMRLYHMPQLSLVEW